MSEVGSTLRIRFPCSAMEMRRVSSETTRQSASVSSESPTAARCRVPRLRSKFGIRAQGQDAARRHDLVAPDDDRPVVQRGGRREDRLDQLGRERRFEDRAGLGDGAQPGVPLQHEDRPQPAAAQVDQGVLDLAQMRGLLAGGPAGGRASYCRSGRAPCAAPAGR